MAPVDFGGKNEAGPLGCLPSYCGRLLSGSSHVLSPPVVGVEVTVLCTDGDLA